jgi:hypothetical protein
MNERIKLLESQCWEARQYGPPWFDYKKFAELIVQECAGRVDHILRERQAGGGTMGDEIREHFGVKQ